MDRAYEKRLSNEDRKLEIELNGSVLQQVQDAKLLGLELDEQLTFDLHIDSLCKQARVQDFEMGGEFL